MPRTLEERIEDWRYRHTIGAYSYTTHVISWPIIDHHKANTWATARALDVQAPFTSLYTRYPGHREARTIFYDNGEMFAYASCPLFGSWASYPIKRG